MSDRINDMLLITDTELEILDATFVARHPAAHRALKEWAEFHDIDPMRVPLHSCVVRNVEACRVEYDEIVLDADGNPVFLEGADWDTRRVHSQGEAPPLPWPPEVWEVAE